MASENAGADTATGQRHVHDLLLVEQIDHLGDESRRDRPGEGGDVPVHEHATVCAHAAGARSRGDDVAQTVLEHVTEQVVRVEPAQVPRRGSPEGCAVRG